MLWAPGPRRATLPGPVHWFFTARTFFALCALFIFYATTIPWDVAHAPTLAHVAWIPLWDTARGRLWSIPDMVQNVVLFMPYGFFGFLGLPFVRRRGPAVGVLVMGGLGLALSLLVECLQTMSATRSPSATDLATNFGGAFIGAAVAAVYVTGLQARLRRALAGLLATNPGLLIFGVYLVAVVAGALAPFIPTLDIGLLRANARAFLDNPWGPKPLGALLTDGLLFGALAYLCAKEVPPFLGRKLSFFSTTENSPALSAAFGFVSMAGLAFALEAAQMVIIGHSPGVQDAVAGALFALLGAAALAVTERGGVRPARALGELTRGATVLVLGFAILAPTFRALQPFRFMPIGEALGEITVWQFVPFAALFANINLSTFRNVFEAAAIYLPLGYALFALGRAPRVGFFACLILAEVLEVLQIPVAGRVFDITEGLYAGLMGVAGAWLFTSLQDLGRAPTAAAPRVRVPPPDAATVRVTPPRAGGPGGRA